MVHFLEDIAVHNQITLVTNKVKQGFQLLKFSSISNT